jgi:UDP-glucose 4-epimerase
LMLLEAARDHGIDQFVFSSTCAIYGIPSVIPIREDTPQQPINPYGVSKLVVERMLADFDAAHDCAFRRSRPLIPIHRDHLLRSIATSVGGDENAVRFIC